jgi:thiamine biosynthesis lipoprotein
MRTRFEIVIADDVGEADLRAAAEEAFDEIERVESQLSAHREESELLRLNAEAATRPVRIDARFFALLERAIQLSDATDGTFDMTVGPLLRLWNLQAGAADWAPPDDSTLEEIRATVGMQNLVLDREQGTVRFSRAGVRLDPGAIGKGYALDRAAQLLREAGIQNALLHGGTSSVLALGQSPDRKPWKIAIQHPEKKDELLAEVELVHGQSLSVSGIHGKSVEAGGKRFGHVIDPRSGRPVENALLAAVVSGSATDSDALSTGLLVLGAAGMDVISARRPDAQLLVAEKTAQNDIRVNVSGNAFSRA